jgi:hypothetical protein
LIEVRPRELKSTDLDVFDEKFALKRMKLLKNLRIRKKTRFAKARVEEALEGSGNCTRCSLAFVDDSVKAKKPFHKQKNNVAEAEQRVIAELSRNGMKSSPSPLAQRVEKGRSQAHAATQAGWRSSPASSVCQENHEGHGTC